MWNLKYLKEDLKSKKNGTLLTVEVFKNMANDIFKSLQFTHDIPEDHPNNLVPMLDIACSTVRVPDCTKETRYKVVVV